MNHFQGALVLSLFVAACGGRVIVGEPGIDPVQATYPPGTTTTTTPLPPSNEPPVMTTGGACNQAIIDVQDCDTAGGYTVSSYRAPSASGPELHVIGVYESDSRHSYMNHPRGKATVHVERPGSQILSLNSYEPIDWTITVDRGVTLERVILNGYHDQRATVPSGVPVESHAAEGGTDYRGTCGYAWTGGAGCEADAGRAITSFGGCYHASRFVVRKDPPSCAGGTATRPLACTAILMNGQLVTVSPDTGESAPGPKVDLQAGPGLNSMGKRGNDLFICDGAVARIDATSGAIERSDVPCQAVTADTESIWVQAGIDSLNTYADWNSLKAHKSSRTMKSPYASRFGANGKELLAAWHSTDTIQRMDIATGAVTELKLIGYDDWIFGLDAMPDGRIVVAAPNRVGGLLTFDGTTGKQLTKLGGPKGVAGGYDEYAAIVCEGGR